MPHSCCRHVVKVQASSVGAYVGIKSAGMPKAGQVVSSTTAAAVGAFEQLTLNGACC